MAKIAFITGLTGQDGSYLAELLLSKGYVVHGIMRHSSVFNTERIEHIFHDLNIHYGDIMDGSALRRLIVEILPDEIYNLAAQSHVKVSFGLPEYTAEVSGVGALKILEAVRAVQHLKQIKIYHASTSELFGRVQQVPQTEITPFYPRSPYGVAKLYAHWIIKNYRESYDIFCVNGILFNHESPRRGHIFVTKKITEAAAKIVKGKEKVLLLGNIDSCRDWGHAKDFVYAMWLMLQQDKPDDYVIATGEQYSVRQFCEVTFGFCGFTLLWRGEGLNEEGYDKDTGRVLVQINSRYYRPAEVDSLLGDATKANKKLGWKPTTKFPELVHNLLSEDYASNGMVLPSLEVCLKRIKCPPPVQTADVEWI